MLHLILMTTFQMGSVTRLTLLMWILVPLGWLKQPYHVLDVSFTTVFEVILLWIYAHFVHLSLPLSCWVAGFYPFPVSPHPIDALGLGCLSVGAHTTSAVLWSSSCLGHRHPVHKFFWMMSSCSPHQHMCPYQCSLFLLIISYQSWIASTSVCFLMSSLVLWSSRLVLRQHLNILTSHELVLKLSCEGPSFHAIS